QEGFLEEVFGEARVQGERREVLAQTRREQGVQPLEGGELAPLVPSHLLRKLLVHRVSRISTTCCRAAAVPGAMRRPGGGHPAGSCHPAGASLCSTHWSRPGSGYPASSFNVRTACSSSAS